MASMRPVTMAGNASGKTVRPDGLEAGRAERIGGFAVGARHAEQGLLGGQDDGGQSEDRESD